LGKLRVREGKINLLPTLQKYVNLDLSMKILMTCYEFPPIGGGGSKVVHGLTKELALSGYEVDLVTMGYRGLPRHEAVHGVNVYRVPCVRLRESICTTPEMMSYVFSALPFILKLFKKNKYQLNHTHFIFPDGLIAVLLKKMTGLPYIITAHGSDVPGYNPNRFKFQHQLLRPLWNAITHQAETIISPSEALRSLILNQSRDLKISIIPNGINVQCYQSNRKKKMRILCVTRIFERKGVQYLLRALNGLETKCEVNVVGNGPYLKNLKEEARELNLDINFIGWLDNDSPILKDLYETSQIFVFPSKAENFPVVLLEAMSAGMTIVTTRGTGCQETIGEAGFLVKTEDSAGIQTVLKKLLNDSKLCQQYGRLARQRLENNFNWPSVGNRYIKIYETYGKKIPL